MASGNDLLRNQWFYQHSNLASLQFSYPGLARIAWSYVCLLVLALVLLAFATTPRRRDGAPDRSIKERTDDEEKTPARRAGLPGMSRAAAHAADAMDPQLRNRCRRAVAGGLHYLRGQQAPDGSVLKSVGITALSLRAFLESPEKYSESDGPFITRQVEFMLANVQADGSISTTLQSTAYNTAVALNALAATKNPEVRRRDRRRRESTCSATRPTRSEGYKPDHRFYGGIGYGGGERPDMSNLYIVLEGLKATSDRPEGSRLAEGAGVRQSFAEPQREQ